MTAENNGHGPTVARIRALLAHHESKAAALRTTLELLTGEATEKKRGRPESTTVLAQALALDGARRTKTKTVRPALTMEQIKQRRERSLSLLNQLTTTPQTVDELRGKGFSTGDMRSLGTYSYAGYVKRKGDGWVRTKKVFHP